MPNTNANGRVVAPAVLQPQLSTDVVGFNLENNQANALGQQYITFQETFLPGEVATGSHLVAIVGGQKIPVQMDVKTTNADGSVRSALLTFEQPSISANSSLSFMLSTTGTAFTTGPLSLASLNGSNYNLKVTIALQGGSTVVLDAATLLEQALNAGTVSYWQTGPLATQGRVDVHIAGSLHVTLDITMHADGSTSTDVQFNNDYAMQSVGGTAVYDVTIQQNGSTVLQQSNITEYQYQTWHTVVSTSGPSQTNVVQDINYLKLTGAIPNLDLTSGISPSALSAEDITDNQILGPGSVTQYMPTTGGRPDIGLMPAWNAIWLVTQDEQAAKYALVQADAAGSVPWHYFDPRTGTYLSLTDYPTLWADGRGTPTLTQQPSGSSGWTTDTAHAPDLSYVAYLLTGDRYYLDQLNAQATFAEFATWPTIRQNGLGLVGNGSDQVRAQAWSLRVIDEAAWANPTGSVEQTTFAQLANNNWSWLVSQIPTWTQEEGEAYGYVPGLYGDNTGSTIAPWQQDFFASAAIQAAQMGNADALTFLNWEANFLVGRFLNSANGFNPRDGAAYNLIVGDGAGHYYQTWAQIEQATIAAGASNGNGWANSDGYYAELAAQTLAGIITLTGSAAATQAYNWLMSSGAPYITPYFSDPQFDVDPGHTVSTDSATLSIAAVDATQSEGATGTTTPFTFTVTRGGDTSIATSASWAVAGSGANPAAGSDFAGAVFPSGTVSFAAGETSKTITVNVAGDTVVEPDEGFTVTLSNPAASTTIGTATASGMIRDGGGSAAIGEVTGLSQDTGIPGDFITSVANQMVSGTYTGALAADDVIQVSADGSTWVGATAGAGTWTADVTLLPGEHTLSVRTVDDVGNIVNGIGHTYDLENGGGGGGDTIVLNVGAGQAYSTLAAAVAASRDGDVIAVQAGTYVNDFATISNDITIVGVGGMANFVATVAPPNGKGIFVTQSNVTIQNLSFSGAAVADMNGAGIRYEGGNLVIIDSYFHDNQDGLLANADPDGTIRIVGSEFANNGAGDGYSHNLYVNNIASLVIDDSYFHDASVGHQIKSRAQSTTITNSRIYDGNGTGSYSIDLPNGGVGVIRNNVIQQGPNSDNPAIIHYGGESAAYAGSSLLIEDNVVVNDMSSSSVRLLNNATTVTGTLSDNAVYGLTAGQIASGGATVSGTTFLSSRPTLDTSSGGGGGSAAVGQVTGLSQDTGIPGDFITSVADQTVSGTYTGALAAGDVIQVSANDSTWVSATAGPGTWTADVTLLPGEHTLSVRTVDDAGNIVNVTNHAYDLDLTGSAAVGQVTGLSQDTGIPGDFITSVADQTVSGTYTGALTAGDVIQVSANDSTWVSATAGPDTWTADVTLLAGEHTLSVRTVDDAGNIANGIGHTYDLENGGGGSGDTIFGTPGADMLVGTAGADRMAGLAGDDEYVVNHALDVVIEANGQGTDTVLSSVSYRLAWGQSIEDLTLTGSDNINGTGNSLANTLVGNSGDNILQGRGGDDVLTGGAGNDVLSGGYGGDQFVFNTDLNAATNVDDITDFYVAADTVVMDNAIFTTIAGTDTLTAAQFVANATGTAQDADDHIVYETDTGKLFYDSNGNAAGGAVQFAVLDPGLPVTNADFFII